MEDCRRFSPGVRDCLVWTLADTAPSTSEIEVSGKVDTRSLAGDVRYYLPTGFLLPLSCRFPFSPERRMNVKNVHAMTASMRNWRLNLSPSPCPDPTHLSFLRRLTWSPRTSHWWGLLTHNHISHSVTVVIAKTQQGEGGTPGTASRDLQSSFDRPFGTTSPTPDSASPLRWGVLGVCSSTVRNDKRVWRLLF